MSTQLRTAIADAGPHEVARTRAVLAAAADRAATNQDPAAVLYDALIDDLDRPARTYRTALVAAATLADEAVDQVVADLRSADEPLAYALARELAAAARMSRDTQAAFALEVERRTGPTPHSRDW